VSGRLLDHGLVVVVGAGGVGKTTLAAALALEAARAGSRTLVMTFDPSLRLKDTLGVGEEAKDREVEVPAGTPGRLFASSARRPHDVRPAGAPLRTGRPRGHPHPLQPSVRAPERPLAGVLEYMAVERLFEVAAEGRYDCVVLDTPPTRQALDFLEAPRGYRVLESGALRIALKPWFAEDATCVPRGASAPGPRRGALLRPRGGPQSAARHGRLLPGVRAALRRLPRARHRGGRPAARAADGLRPGHAPRGGAHPETLFFARRLVDAGHRLGPVVVNMRHPEAAHPPGAGARDGVALLAWLGARDARGVARYASGCLAHARGPAAAAQEPSDLASLDGLRAWWPRADPGPESRIVRMSSTRGGGFQRESGARAEGRGPTADGRSTT